MLSLHEYWRSFSGLDVRVSPLGLGTVKLGRDRDVKYPETFQIPDDREVGELLALARDLGINLLDTAPAYGNSEERLGRALRGQRQRWVVVSKSGEDFINGQSHHDFSAAHTRYSVERSLTRLGTDYLDVLLVHSDGRDLDILAEVGLLETLDDLRREGKICAWGLSGKTAAGNLQALERGDCAMVTFNLREQAERPVLAAAGGLGKSVLIKKALASGHACLDSRGDPVAEVFREVFAYSGVASVIVGTISPMHLRQNVQSLLTALDA